MIVLRTPKGWTGPKEVDGLPVEGTWRAHQVPLADVAREPRAPRAARGVDAELPAGGALRRRTAGSSPSCARSRPTGDRRMSANPHANGGLLLRDLDLPDFRDYAVDGRRARRTTSSEATRVLGELLRDVIVAQPGRNFRLFGPDETASNRLGDVFEVDRPRLGRRDRCRPTTTSRRTAG